MFACMLRCVCKSALDMRIQSAEYYNSTLDKNLNFLYFTKYRLCVGHSTFGCPLHVFYMRGEVS